MATKEDIINHIGFFLTEQEKETVYNFLMEEAKKGNIFYSYFSLHFYYGKLTFKRLDSRDNDATYVKGTYKKEKWEIDAALELVPFEKLNLKIGDKIDTRERFKHKLSNQYGYEKPPVEIIEVSDTIITVRFTYTHYKKNYERIETFNRKELEDKIYRNAFKLI